MDQNNRLTTQGVTLRQMLKLSYKYYKSSKGDSKDWRAILDISRATLRGSKNFEYDKTESTWVQTGRNIKMEFICSTKPISYEKKDSIPIHKYPVTFLIRDFNAGLDSTFKFRTGSQFKPKFSAKGMSADQTKKITEYNIKKGIQMQFFFELSYVLFQRGLLYGKNWAKWKPMKTNPKGYVFFDKHSFFIFKKMVVKLLTSNRELVKKALGFE